MIVLFGANSVCSGLQKILLFLFFLFVGNSGLLSQVNISKVALNIGSSVTVNIRSDLKVSDDAVFINNGVFDVLSKDDIEIWYDAMKSNSSLGRVYLRGSGDISFVSNNLEVELSDLIVGCKTLNIETNLSVKDEIDFRNGIINVFPNCVLSLLNTKSNSLVYSKAPNKYIKGYLSRKVNSGESFIFPIGGDEGLCFMEFDDINADDNIKVGFIPFDNSLLSGKNNYSKAVDGLWDISSDNDDLSYSLRISLENVLEYDNNVIYRLLRTDDIPSSNDLGIERSELTYPLVKADDAKTDCRYLLVTDVSFKIVNMVVVNGKCGGIFKLPEVPGVDWGELSVIDAQGKLVFHSKQYANDFCVNDLTEGTYFYRLYYTKSGEKYIIKNFIEVVYEK